MDARLHAAFVCWKMGSSRSIINYGARGEKQVVVGPTLSSSLPSSGLYNLVRYSNISIVDGSAIGIAKVVVVAGGWLLFCSGNSFGRSS